MEQVFLRILNMNLSAAVVICAVVLVRLALKRAPKKWSYLLWCVVAFRLLCPVSLSAPFSVLRLTAQSAAVTQSASGAASDIVYIPQDIGNMASPRVYVGTPAVSETISRSLPATTPYDSANPMQIWIAVGTALWLAGTAALLLYGLISYVNLRRRLAGAVRAGEGVSETDAVRAPFILGLLRPVICLPVGLEGEKLRYVLAHERFHIRHGDHIVKVLAYLLLCVHWFDPLVWLAFFLMGRDMEMRCDEGVLSAENGIKKPYSMALLSFATARRFPSPSPLAFGETGVKQRIQNALRWKKPKVWVTVLAAVLCAVAVAACAVNPNKEETKQGTPWDWTSSVTAGAIKSAEGNGVTLDATQTEQLVSLLNAVQPSEVVRGRGIPSNKTLDITTGVGYRLRWAGGIIELDFDDAAAAAELYGGGTGEPGPGVWEIRNDALYAFLEGLEDTTPASASDLASASEQYRAQRQRWNAEVDMLGEALVSEAGEEGNWWDVREAFASRWCQKYLNAHNDSPYHCADAGVWSLGEHVNAVSLSVAPGTLVFDVTLALGLPAEQVDAFVYARDGLVDRVENGLVYVSTEAVLQSNDGIHWVVEGLNTGGSAGWGFRELYDSERTRENIRYALENKESDILLHYLPNLNWSELSGGELKTAMELLRSAAVSEDPSYLDGQDQMIRDLYMLWGLKRADGAFAELYLDGPESILARQQRADPDAFAAALNGIDTRTQALVRQALGL